MGLFPSLALKTGEISQKLGRGRHTTRHIELYPINNALIGDTPGFGALDLEGYQISRKALRITFRNSKNSSRPVVIQIVPISENRPALYAQRLQTGRLPQADMKAIARSIDI